MTNRPMCSTVLLAFCSALLLGCAQESIPAPAARAHNEAIVRGSAAPAAPVRLDYELPATLVANTPATVVVALDTRLDHGSMLVEIAGHEGVSLLCDTRHRFDLAAVRERPIMLPLRVLPLDQAERFLAVLVTVDTEMGAMVRSFRIDLTRSAAPAAQSQKQNRAVLHR